MRCSRRALVLCLDGLYQAVEVKFDDTSEDAEPTSYKYPGRETSEFTKGRSWLGMFFPFVLRPSALELLAVFCYNVEGSVGNV